jgi:hypothetical protein
VIAQRVLADLFSGEIAPAAGWRDKRPRAARRPLPRRHTARRVTAAAVTPP